MKVTPMDGKPLGWFTFDDEEGITGVIQASTQFGALRIVSMTLNGQDLLSRSLSGVRLQGAVTIISSALWDKAHRCWKDTP